MRRPLTKQEKALLRIIKSDIHAPQFFWKSSNGVDPYRVYDYQYYLEDNEEDTSVINSDARAVGKTEKLKRGIFTYPFRRPGREKLVTAPQEVHLTPLMDQIIDRLQDVRISREMLTSVKRKPYYQIKFANRTRIIGKIPGNKGVNVKGEHVDSIEIDEGQDYIEEGYINVRECLNEVPGKQLRVWGVPNGVRNTFFGFTRSDDFKKVCMPAMYKTTWGPTERREKIAFYGSRRSPGYSRNIYAEHGDAEYLVFLPSKLDMCIDHGKSRRDGTFDKENPKYTNDYAPLLIINEDINRNMPFTHYLRFPSTHKKYERVWVGVDVAHHGSDPTEILIWAEEEFKGKNRVRLISRIHCERVTDDDQADILQIVCDEYNVVGVALDATARGGTVWEKLLNKKLGDVKLSGYVFNSTKEISKTKDDVPIKIRIKQLCIEILQNMCDHKEFLIPYDDNMVADWMGLKMKPTGTGKFDIVKDIKYKTHTLYAAGMMALQREDFRLGNLSNSKGGCYVEGGWVDDHGNGVPGAFG